MVAALPVDSDDGDAVVLWKRQHPIPQEKSHQSRHQNEGQRAEGALEAAPQQDQERGPQSKQQALTHRTAQQTYLEACKRGKEYTIPCRSPQGPLLTGCESMLRWLGAVRSNPSQAVDCTSPVEGELLRA